MSTPFILLLFGQLSLIAPLTNLLVLPFIPAVMGIGFLAGLVGLLSIPVGQFLGWFAWMVLHAILVVIRISSELPFAAVSFQKFPTVLILIYYFGLISLLIVFYHPKIKASLWNRKQSD